MALTLKRQPKFPPRAPRYAVAIPSYLLLQDDRELPARIKNLSEEGVMIETKIDLPPGSMMGIWIPDYGIVRAQVRWMQDGWFGARFEKPLDLEQIPDPNLKS